MPARRSHYVVSTHWDREWYQPYQDYRYRLVRLLDNALSGLASGEMRGPFTTDGQAIILEDYLEVRTEREALVRACAADGRLRIGPWYVLPDEFLVSGEALIRNLRLGREVARALGGVPSNAGFVCDIFGHNSQLPQILTGFGMEMAFVWRGVNESGQRLFRWIGADDAEVLAYRFEQVGYSSYASLVRSSFDHATEVGPDDIADKLDGYLQAMGEQTETDSVLLFDGGDHQEWDRAAYQVLAARLGCGDGEFEIVHTTLDEFAAEALAQRERVTTTHRGELREPARWPGALDNQWLIPGVLSSRIWIKQRNAACQALLCHWAEPLATLAAHALGEAYPQGYLDVAWRWLLQNQPHDSICGCSIDQVHEDMLFRFSQCEQIGNRLTTEAARVIAANIAAPLPPEELRVVLFNPLPRTLEQVVSLELQTPAHWPAFNEFFGFEPKPAFRIFDPQGEEIAYQRLSQAMGQPQTRITDVKFPESYRTNDVGVALAVTLPALGYTTLTVRPEASGEPTRHPAMPTLANSGKALENEHLRVEVAANGTLTLTDKANGAVYAQLLAYEDCADIGDGWYHGQAVNDQMFSSTACSADVALVANGPLLATLRVRATMRLPEAFGWGEMRRSDALRELVFDSLVTLRRCARRVEIETRVENTICDHRVRVLFPTGASAETFWTDTPFDVVERPIALRADNHLYRELEVEGKPQQSLTAVWDGQRGLAVISQGLPEVAVLDQLEQPIALTLYRSTRRTVGTAGEPGGQLLQTLRFACWIEPLAAAPNWADLSESGQLLNAGLRDIQMTAQDLPFYRREADVPSEACGLTLKGSIVLTSLRQVEGAVELRLFNPEAASAEAQLVMGPALAHLNRAQRVDLDSRALGAPWALTAPRIQLALEAKQIMTLRLSANQ
jgi:alpha-mannosidase/mannosylglycerate hydrolase